MGDGVRCGLSNGTSGEPQFTLENEELKQLSIENEDNLNRKYPGNRTYKEYVNLARDPSHGNKVLPQGRKERDIGLDLERQGKLHNIRRDTEQNKNAEFIDGDTGIKWDIKSFVSHPNGQTNPRKGAFEVGRAVNKIKAEINNGHNVIIDTRRLTKQHLHELEQAVNDEKLSEKIIWYNKKGG